MRGFDIKKDLQFWDKIKIKGFREWEERYFICYFKYWILCTNQELENETEEQNFDWTLYSCLINDWNNLYYSTQYKEYDSLKGEIKEVEIDWKNYEVEVKKRLNT